MVAILTSRTWYNIRLTALTHGLHFNTKQSRDGGYETVRHALLEEGALQRAYRRLSATERAGLG